MKAWIDAVIAALREPFPDAGLYDEKVKAPWEPGDFYISLSDYKQERQVGLRFRQLFTVKIQYKPRSCADAYDTAQKLSAHLEYIRLGEYTVRPGQMSMVFKDDQVEAVLVLEVFVTKPETPGTKMKQWKQEGTIREQNETSR
jgi:hypothetical protein